MASAIRARPKLTQTFSNKSFYHQRPSPIIKHHLKMAPRTITNQNQLQELIEQNPLVVVAGLDVGFEPGDMKFERIAQEYGQSNVVFAKFFLEEAPELVTHFEIDDVATVITLNGGQKGPTVSGFEPDRWEEMLREMI